MKGTGDAKSVLEAARALWERDERMRAQLERSVPREAMERRCARLQRQVDESHAALRRRNAKIDELRERMRIMADHSSFEHGLLLDIAGMLGVPIYGDDGSPDAYLTELGRRLMPHGMEWPKVDGEPVDFKTGYEPSLGVLEAVSIYNNGACEVMSHDGIVKNATEIHVFKPKVLDADGVEIRVGDVLYRKSDGHMVKVAEVYEKTFADADDYVRPGDGYTHRAPVFAADGKPLREGEHVYHVETGAELVVKELPKPGEYQAVVVFAPPASHLTSFDPDQLTHERPESWERLWMDMHPADKTECVGLDREEFVRRAKALTERSE